MRNRLIRKLLATVRPHAQVNGDQFGDKSMVTADNRDSAFERVPMQVTVFSGRRFAVGKPGGDVDVKAEAFVLQTDIDRFANGWIPRDYDLIILPDGESLFVMDVQPAQPRMISIRFPSGGFSAYRLSLSSSLPETSGATQYE